MLHCIKIYGVVQLRGTELEGNLKDYERMQCNFLTTNDKIINLDK